MKRENSPVSEQPVPSGEDRATQLGSNHDRHNGRRGLDPSQLSVVVCTKNRPEYLGLALLGLAAQEDRPGEVVVSDAGEPATEVVDRAREATDLNIKHCCFANEGFRLAVTRNVGASNATGEWLVFIDGDIVLLPGAIGCHARHATDAFTALAGGRTMLDRELSGQVTKEAISSKAIEGMLTADEIRCLHWEHRRNRLYDLIRHRKRPHLHGHQFSLSKRLFRAVNGFDENYVGWGAEDVDFRDRIVRKGARIRSLVGFAIGIHLWHPMHSTIPEKGAPLQSQGYHDGSRLRPAFCADGVDKHIAGTGTGQRGAR